MSCGGWKEHSVDDGNVKDLSWRAVEHVSKQSNDLHHPIPVKVLSAKSQVVAGTKWEIEILVGQTKCTKKECSPEEFKTRKCSEEKEGGRRQVYVVNIWQKPWEDFEEITIKEVKEAN